MHAPQASLQSRRAMYNDNALQDRPVRRQLLVRPRRDHGAGALVGQLAGQSRARRRWPTRPASTSCCRSAAGRATAATPTIRARRSRPSPGRPGCSAHTKRITVFGTVHAPLFHPMIAAKQIVTADHVGEGRFGLNIVVGWNEGEFEMFGVDAARARASATTTRRNGSTPSRWPGSDRRISTSTASIIKLKKRPRQAQALRRHAAADHERRRLADRPGLRDPQLRRLLHCNASRTSMAETAQKVRDAQGRGARAGPRDRRLHGRRRHLPADPEGGRGVLPPLHHRERRLVGGRRHPGDEEHLAADRGRCRNF